LKTQQSYLGLFKRQNMYSKRLDLNAFYIILAHDNMGVNP